MDRSALKICFFAALFWAIVANLNVGFIAIDDYMHGISLYIPAQFSSFEHIVKISEFRSPLPNLFLFSLSSLALKLGVQDPVLQLKFVTTLVTLLNAVGLLFAVAHFRLGSWSESAILEKFMALVGGFYFLSPLFMTRPLIESISVSFLTVSSYFMLRAYRGRQPALAAFLSVLALAVACVFRYQVGLWALGYAALLIGPHRNKAILGLIAGGVLGFLATGLPDYFLKGAFHSSLKSYVAYNLEHSSIYGTTPFYSYLLLLIGLSLPPTFFARYRGFDWKEYTQNFLPLLIGFAAFVAGHSAVPHKEERFMVPVLFLFFILLVPLLVSFRTRQRWRLKYFMGLNLLLVLPASLNPPQINTIRLVKFLENKHPEKTLYKVAEGNFIFPLAFSANQQLQVKDRSLNEIAHMSLACSDLIAVRYDQKEALLSRKNGLLELFVSRPGPLEQIVVWLNPGKNARRGPITVFQKEGCGS